MAIKTSRTAENAEVKIDDLRCLGCGLCVEACSMTLSLENGRVRVNQAAGFGCVGCGQCMAVCPNAAITVTGRTLSPEDAAALAPAEARAGYDALQGLMFARRSVRKFTDREVDREAIERILQAAATAPTGMPPSDVAVTVLAGRDKVREFAVDCIELLLSKRWLFSPVMAWLLRPFVGKEATGLFESFMRPFIGHLENQRRQGEDGLLYGAPLAMIFQASPYSDPADAQVAATYAMLAAEAMGIGTCMIGAVMPMVKHSSRLKEKYKLLPKAQNGLVVIFGYSALKYQRGIKRTFARVEYY